MEVFKKYQPVPGFPEISVSVDGEFIYTRTGKIIKINYTGGSGPRIFSTHYRHQSSARLYALTFIGPAPSRLHMAEYVNEDKKLGPNSVAWVTVSDMQKNATERRHREEVEMFPFDKDLPGPIESEYKPGYYHIPFVDSRVVVNKEGHFFDLYKNKPSKISKNHKGYLFVSLRVGGVYHNYGTHRVIAMLFCDIPERHRMLSYGDLQVNHIDGVKTNNHCKNLEWVTNDENMQHARSTGLFNNETRVVGKNLATGEIIKFKSISECARWLCMTSSSMHVHLFSVCAGMISRDGYVFKLDDGRPWPDLIECDKKITTLHHVCDVIAENVETGKKILCKNLISAIACADLVRNTVMGHRSRNGPEVPYKGWIFYQFKPREK